MGAPGTESLEDPTTRPRTSMSAGPVRVVYVLANEGYGGTEIHLRGLVTGLDRAHFDPTVLLSANAAMDVLAKELGEAGVEVGVLPTVGCRFDLPGIVDLARVIRAQRADIIHVQMPTPMGGFAAVLAARLAGVPVVVSTDHSHAYHLRSVTGLRGHVLRATARLRFRLSDRAIAVSAGQQASFTEVLGVRPDKLTAIPNGIDPDRYAHGNGGSAVRRELGVPGSAPVAGMVTSYAEYERTEDFIRAADHVAAVLHAAHFLIAGDQHPVVGSGDAARMRADLERLAEAFGLSDRVHFLGYRTDMPPIMAALDVFVLPARYKSFGLVLLEAMASELPVVATAAGGIPEIVRNDETGLLVPPLDPRELGMAMIRVMTNKEEALGMGQRGRHRVEQLFTENEMIDRTTNLYQLLLARRSGRTTLESARRA
jgi:glycosyltransferase involved in cell wall biosynthesis